MAFWKKCICESKHIRKVSENPQTNAWMFTNDEQFANALSSLCK